MTEVLLEVVLLMLAAAGTAGYLGWRLGKRQKPWPVIRANELPADRLVTDVAVVTDGTTSGTRLVEAGSLRMLEYAGCEAFQRHLFLNQRPDGRANVAMLLEGVEVIGLNSEGAIHA